MKVLQAGWWLDLKEKESQQRDTQKEKEKEKKEEEKEEKEKETSTNPSSSTQGRMNLTPMILRNLRCFEPVHGSTLQAVIDSQGGTAVDLLLLMRLGSRVTRRNMAHGETAFLRAVRRGRGDLIGYLVKRGCDPLQKNRSGEKALIAAILHRQTQSVEALTSSGVNVNACTSKDGRSALQVALSDYLVDIRLVEALLAAGASPVKWSSFFLLPVQWSRADLVGLLLSKGADVNTRNEQGWTALMVAVSNSWVEGVKALLSAGADVNARGKDGRTALSLAIVLGRNDVARILVEGGADVHRRDEAGGTLLMLAVCNNRRETVKFLVSAARADIDAARKDGSTALLLAVRHGRTELVKILVEAGADVGLTGKDGKNAMTVAALYGQEEIEKTLLKVVMKQIVSRPLFRELQTSSGINRGDGEGRKGGSVSVSDSSQDQTKGQKQNRDPNEKENEGDCRGSSSSSASPDAKRVDHQSGEDAAGKNHKLKSGKVHVV